MDTPLAPLVDLAKGRFSDLKPLVKNLTMSDLSFMDAQTFAELFPYEQRILAYVFWKRTVAPLLDTEGPVPMNAEDLKGHSPQYQPLWIEECGYLSYQGIILNDRYASKYDPEFLVSELLESVQKFNPVQTLDLSFSNLCDENMSIILEAVKACRCHVLILRNNRFFGKGQPFQEQLDPALIAILDLPFVRFVDITLNGLATSERADFFVSRLRQHLAKLIFIPIPWVEDPSSWSRLLGDSADSAAGVQLCQQAHRVYYKSVAVKLPVRIAWLKGVEELGSSEDVPLWQAEQTQ